MARGGPIQTFTDLDKFLAAAGDVREIDFETLPDGSPTYWGVDITPEFNYTEQGVTFSSHIPQLEIRGTGEVDFYLTTSNPTSERNWIIADFSPHAWAVGIAFPGHTTLSAFDAQGQPIGSIFGGGSGGGHFLGIVSDVPIASATGDRGGETDVWYSFFFTPVPEPGTLALLVGALALLVARRP
jgi:hypothetical protein